MKSDAFLDFKPTAPETPSVFREFLYRFNTLVTMGFTKPRTNWVPGPFYLGIKWLGRKDDHSFSSSAKLRISGRIPPPPSAWRSA